MNIKILPLPWYCKFNNTWPPTSSPAKEKLKLLSEDDYDGPLSYIAEVSGERLFKIIKDCKLQEKEDIQYCVPLRYMNKLSENSYKYYKYYFYTFNWQHNKWWISIKPDNLFYDLHIPITTYEEYLKVKDIPLKFLTPKVKVDIEYWRFWYDSRKICRNIRKSFMKLEQT